MLVGQLRGLSTRTSVLIRGRQIVTRKTTLVCLYMAGGRALIGTLTDLGGPVAAMTMRPPLQVLIDDVMDMTRIAMKIFETEVMRHSNSGWYGIFDI